MAEPLPPGKYPGFANSPVGEAIRAGHLPGGAEGALMKEEWEKLQEEKKAKKHKDILVDNAGQPMRVINNGKG